MAKYTAAPNYAISGGIQFTPFGIYETDNAKEIALLDSLTPTWITRVEDGKKPEEPAQVDDEQTADKPEKEPPKAPSKPRKANATSSAK